MNTPDNSERVVRMERDLHHISSQVDSIDKRQAAHELENRSSFDALRENALRQQIATENLVTAVKQVAEANNKRLEDVEKKQEDHENRIEQVENKWNFSLLLGKGVVTIITTPTLLYIAYKILEALKIFM